MTIITKSFPPIIDTSSKVLILGSMPGAESLQLNQYYANRRNTFWKIMKEILRFSDKTTYQEKIVSIKKNRIALWDVIHSCERIGSLDSNIKQSSIKTNDFNSFFQKYSNIDKILFNGKKAETEFMKKVFPTLPNEKKEITLLGLPSTSPAMALITFDEKLNLWIKAFH